jgi:hypothetical protein
MSDVEPFVRLLMCVQEADDGIRVPADHQLESMRKTDPVDFTARLYAVVQLASNPSAPASVIRLAMILARQEFRRSARIREMEEPSLSWALIPPDMSAAYANTLYPFFADARACISDFAAELLAQISASAVLCGSSAELIYLPIQDLPSMAFPCAIFFRSLLDEIAILAEIQMALFHAVGAVPLTA